jgi:hypothetical protein
MRAATVALALVLAANASAADPRKDRTRASTRTGGRLFSAAASATAVPAFQFAAASGTGMGLPCAGTTPTGTKGEAITLAARAGTRSCMKGNERSSIANGDLVKLPANQYAVQPGGDGTGPLGISVWGARTNYVLHSEAIDNADWTGFGDFIPTVTADYGVAPDGTTTADRVQFVATSAGQRTFMFQAACPTGSISLSCFVKGVSGSGTMDLGTSMTGGWAFSDCAYVSTSWTRCVSEALAGTAATSLFSFGNTSSVNGGVARSANDVMVWGCQCEAGDKASPYIPTVAATATRATELATYSSTAAATVSVGATLAFAGASADNAALASLSTSAANEVALTTLGAKDRCDFNVAGTHSYLNGLNNLLTPVTQAAACTYASSSQGACAGSACKSQSGALTLPTGAATLFIGGLADGGTANGTVKNVCLDTNAALCRPAGSSAVSCPFSGTESQRLAAIGDSIMKGASTIQMVDEMRDRVCSAGRGVDSFAVSGSTIADCTTQYTTSIQGHAYRIVATNCGINNVLAGESAAVAWGKLQTLLNQIVADGFFVIVGNLTPCSQYSGCNAVGADAVIATFNASEATWCSTHTATARCLDNNTLLGSGSNLINYNIGGAQLGSLCAPSSDGLHPNNYCTTKLADAFADAALDAGL